MPTPRTSTARTAILPGLLLLLGLLPAVTRAAEHRPAASIPQAALIEPAALAATLKDGASPKPLLLQVGFRALYLQAHIPGSLYAGPGNDEAGLALLRGRVEKLPKDAPIVIYCGCCPWSRCPNMAAAYDELQRLGYTRVRALHIADNFGTNWVDLGFPTATGE